RGPESGVEQVAGAGTAGTLGIGERPAGRELGTAQLGEQLPATLALESVDRGPFLPAEQPLQVGTPADLEHLHGSVRRPPDGRRPGLTFGGPERSPGLSFWAGRHSAGRQ